jgi:hypothetical protein
VIIDNVRRPGSCEPVSMARCIGARCVAMNISRANIKMSGRIGARSERTEKIKEYRATNSAPDAPDQAGAAFMRSTRMRRGRGSCSAENYATIWPPVRLPPRAGTMYRFAMQLVDLCTKRVPSSSSFQRAASQALEYKGPERSAAWLAHQSGGLGVGSSNLPAPTNDPKEKFTLLRTPTESKTALLASLRLQNFEAF